MHKQFQPANLPDQAISTEKAPGEGTAGQERGLDPAAQAPVAAGDGAWAPIARCRLGFLA